MGRDLVQAVRFLSLALCTALLKLCKAVLCRSTPLAPGFFLASKFESETASERGLGEIISSPLISPGGCL